MTVNGSRRQGLLLIGVVFLLGLVCGSALTVIGVRTVLPQRLHRIGGPPPTDGAERILRRLDLEPGQRRQVAEILERRGEEIHQIFQESGNEIREILTEEQQGKFDEMRRRHERGPMRRRHPGARPEHPPPPEN